jgi:hypothetical protein
MYAAIRHYKIDASRVDEAIKQVTEGFRPIISQAPGLVEYFGIKTPDGVVSVSIFDSRESLEASARLAQSWVREHMAPFVTSASEALAGDVILDDVLRR